MKSKSMIACAAAVIAAGLFSSAQSQPYPAKAVRAISPFPPGGVTDKVLRPLALELGKRFEQPVVVDSRPGADNIIGADACAKSNPDGHTFCVMPIDALVLNPFLFKSFQVASLRATLCAAAHNPRYSEAGRFTLTISHSV